MNSAWQNFIDAQPINHTSSDNVIYPIDYLSILKVSGDDAAHFLQGQLTCNVKELNENNSFFTGFCNAKGRVISTLLILKQAEAFLLILPTALADKVTATLTRYILRSKVQLSDVTDEYALSGFSCSQTIAAALELPQTLLARKAALLKLSAVHYLIVASVAETIDCWTHFSQHGLQLSPTQTGQWLDLNAGLAWLAENTSEEYIPQMLNLDKLGGISFNKGCYTGQEVVARTHYLGQVKRELFLAQSAADAQLSHQNNLLDSNGQVVGNVLTVVYQPDCCRLLAVLQSDAALNGTLKLDNFRHDSVTVFSSPQI